MDIHLSKASLSILDVLYHYHFAWKKDLDSILGLAARSSYVQRELHELKKKELLYSKVLDGDGTRKLYALTQKGYTYLKKNLSFPEQDIEERDLRLENLTTGFLRHEGLVTHASGEFFKDARRHDIELVDRRGLLSHIEPEARTNRESDRVKLFQVRASSTAVKETQRPDDLFLLQRPGHRGSVVCVEVDRGTESLRPRVGKTIKGQVAGMMNVYIEAYRRKFFRTYFGDFNVRVMFIISTSYSGQKRKKNFEDLWHEVGEGRSPNFPCFTTLDEFEEHGPINLLNLPLAGKK